MVKNAVGLASQAIVALLVEQVTNSPKLEGLNPFTIGTKWKWLDYIVSVAKQALVALLVEQVTNSPKLEGLNPFTTVTRWNW